MAHMALGLCMFMFGHIEWFFESPHSVWNPHEDSCHDIQAAKDLGQLGHSGWLKQLIFLKPSVFFYVIHMGMGQYL